MRAFRNLVGIVSASVLVLAAAGCGGGESAPDSGEPVGEVTSAPEATVPEDEPTVEPSAEDTGVAEEVVETVDEGAGEPSGSNTPPMKDSLYLNGVWRVVDETIPDSNYAFGLDDFGRLVVGQDTFDYTWTITADDLLELTFENGDIFQFEWTVVPRESLTLTNPDNGDVINLVK